MPTTDANKGVLLENGEITQAIQVASKTYLCEMEAFKNIKCDNCLLITAEEERRVSEFGKTIHIVPAWKMLLS